MRYSTLPLGLVLLLLGCSGQPTASRSESHPHADDRAECQQRIDRAEHRLQQEIREHGEHSPQADNRRRELSQERQHYQELLNEHLWRDEHDNPNYQRGYNDGMEFGRNDLGKYRPYQPEKYKAYKKGDEFYRRGFMDGYNEGSGHRP